MKTAQFEQLSSGEGARVLRWRFDSCVRAGYSERQALILAHTIEADLHLAVELLRRGCSPETALRILL